jgi:hypothetical protein
MLHNPPAPPSLYALMALEEHEAALKKALDDASVVLQAFSRVAETAASTVIDQRRRLESAEFTYSSRQATTCASCGQHKHTPLRNDTMGGYVCLTCIDRELLRLQDLVERAPL